MKQLPEFIAWSFLIGSYVFESVETVHDFSVRVGFMCALFSLSYFICRITDFFAEARQSRTKP